MADIPACVWTGASGKAYKYFIYPRHPKIKAGQDGNYIYCKHSADDSIAEPVYIGQGDLSVRCTSSHHQSDCIDTKGATHVHLRVNSGEQSRLAEERDLLEAYPQAYAPSGCNVRQGG